MVGKNVAPMIRPVKRLEEVTVGVLPKIFKSLLCCVGNFDIRAPMCFQYQMKETRYHSVNSQAF